MPIPQQTLNVVDEPWTDDAPEFDRMPPQDHNAEQCVLGGMLLSKDAIGDVIEELAGPGDFYKPAHQTVYETVLALYAAGEPVDAVTVADALTKAGNIQRVGGATYLHTLIQTVPTAANAQYYAGIVAERAVFRRLAETGTRIAQQGYTGEGGAQDAVDQAQADLFKVLGDQKQNDALPLSETSHLMLDRIEARKGRGGLRGLATGFTDLDSLTNGLMGGQLIVIAARPAMGKSTLAIDLARACSIKHSLPSVIFSLEMGREEIEDRILSAEARVGHHHIQTGELTESDWERVARRMPDIQAAPLYIDDAANQSYMEIAAKARRLKQKHDIRLVILDYMQLMTLGGRRPESRQQEVSEISRNLKLLAKSLDVPVVALSQLNRESEKRQDRKPMVSDLRESGSIEQDADMVILLHREDAYEKESPRAGEADLIVGKHRGGPTATITVAFQGHYSRFVDMAQS
ncbi:replicative DNA helicase [Streptomyces sp. NPDC056982]|uniref:replicative DNA helicase n=1 Tax=Streptomyces sp. NPDC056982 TaxID=3345986 RepID=UPI003625C58A